MASIPAVRLRRASPLVPLPPSLILPCRRALSSTSAPSSSPPTLVGCVPKILDRHRELVEWRHDFHMHPELSFEEVRTSGVVADRLQSWGIEVFAGFAKTGVVGKLVGRHPVPDGAKVTSVGLRADMDALAMDEETGAPHASKSPGKFHGCGHDGHTTMLLGAAQYLAETRDFAGTVHFIFQPAEEMFGGGRLMVEEGLFEKFPCHTVYGIHNWPLIPEGTISARAGPIMASNDEFEFTITGHGGHAAMPHLTIDPVLIGCQVVNALQGLISRSTDPLDAAVLSVTQFNAGSEAPNVIPNKAKIGGTMRAFEQKTRERLQQQIRRSVSAVVEGFGAEVDLEFIEGYPATVNHKYETELAAMVAAEIVGPQNVIRDATPTMGAEDFSFMLNERPGCYIWLGSGGGEANPCMVHDPKYDFNDGISPIGASWFVRMVEASLSPKLQHQ